VTGLPRADPELGHYTACAAPLAYTVKSAAAAVSLGETAIRALMKSGALPSHYLNSKPIILASDLIACIRALPVARTRPALESPDESALRFQ
jgi:hypothetical protein